MRGLVSRLGRLGCLTVGLVAHTLRPLPRHPAGPAPAHALSCVPRLFSLHMLVPIVTLLSGTWPSYHHLVCRLCSRAPGPRASTFALFFPAACGSSLWWFSHAAAFPHFHLFHFPRVLGFPFTVGVVAHSSVVLCGLLVLLVRSTWVLPAVPRSSVRPSRR